MLSLRDQRSGSLVGLPGGPSVPLRLLVHPPAAGGEPGPEAALTGLRVLLVADILMRIAELQGRQAVLALAAGELPAASVTELGQLAGLLGIHPAAAAADRGEAEAILSGPADVHLTAGTRVEGDPGVVVGVGGATGLTPEEIGADDPLNVRFVLLSRRYAHPAELTPAELSRAGEMVGQWRRDVAGWAEEPSRPMPATSAEAIRAALDDDLDTAGVMTGLRRLADIPGQPAGTKFETFVFADRILALELMREIGRAR